VHRRRAVEALIGMLLASRARASPPAESDWPSLKRTIRRRFPEVRQIGAAQLRDALERPDAPILIDARTAAEYAASHLRAARRAETFAEAANVLTGEAKDRAVVVYCSVGYRSSALARSLMRAGYTNVANLEGSIFEWANKGWPVYRGEQPVTVVHPYDAAWGRLLERKLWSTD
jgi:rhodanese-related sulfurtransferase